MAEAKALHEAQVDAVLAEYNTLRAAVRQYHEEMEEAMAATADTTNNNTASIAVTPVH